MNPYFTDADMVQRLVAAAQRGVKVRIVVSETSNNPRPPLPSNTTTPI